MAIHLTRRAFLERATCAAAVLTAARPAAAADGLGRRSLGDLSAVASAKAEGGWFVSLNGALTRGVSGADKARLAAATGYGGVDWISVPRKPPDAPRPRRCSPNSRSSQRSRLPDGAAVPFGGDDQAFRAALTQLADDAAFSAAIGCQKMMVVLPPSTTEPKQDQLKRVRDRFAAISEVLSDRRFAWAWSSSVRCTSDRHATADLR